MSNTERKMKQMEHIKEIAKYIGAIMIVAIVAFIFINVFHSLTEYSLQKKGFASLLIGYFMTSSACGIIVGLRYQPSIFGTTPFLIGILLFYYSICIILGSIILPLYLLLHLVAFIYHTIQLKILEKAA